MRRLLAALVIAASAACVHKPPSPAPPTPPPSPSAPVDPLRTIAATTLPAGAPVQLSLAGYDGSGKADGNGYVAFQPVPGGCASGLPAITPIRVRASLDGYAPVDVSQSIPCGNQNVPIQMTRTAPKWTTPQLMDFQGDLMIWAPDVACAPEAISASACASARGLAAGWVWSLTINRHNAANREKLYQDVIKQGQTHVAVQVVCDGGDGYHGLYPDDCANYGPKTQTVINELKAHNLIPVCAGVSPTAKLAAGIDPASCPIAMPDWDNSCDADARLRAIGDAFPSSTLLYVEMPTGCSTHPVLDPGTTPISIAPDPNSGGHWIMGAQKRYPNFVGVMYEINTPDGTDANLALLATANAWWRDIQQVWFESDTYWKFWEALPNASQRAYNDNIMRLSPQLKGCMSGCSTHPVIPDTPPSAGGLSDTLDMSTAIIEHDDASMGRWPVTTTITALDLLPSGVHVEFSKADGPTRWPDTPDYEPSGGMGPLQYSIGLCFNLSGTWHCSAPIELWYGLAQNGGNIGAPGQVPSNWFYDNRWGAMQGYQPKAGELVGVYVVAGDARNNVYVVKERSNVVLVPFPTAAGARFR